jgi:hypothetical protein
MWGLGVAAVLVVALALIGVRPEMTEPSRADLPARPPRDDAAAKALGPRASSPGGVAASAGPAEVEPTGVEPTEHEPTEHEPTEDVTAGDEPASLQVDHAQAAPGFRLPEELAPFAPEVVVAMEPAQPDGDPAAVPAHTHLEDSAHDDAMIAAGGIAAQAGDDIQGPEPGAVFWFGPLGLERVRTFGEAPR